MGLTWGSRPGHDEGCEEGRIRYSMAWASREEMDDISPLCECAVREMGEEGDLQGLYRRAMVRLISERFGGRVEDSSRWVEEKVQGYGGWDRIVDEVRGSAEGEDEKKSGGKEKKMKKAREKKKGNVIRVDFRNRRRVD